MALSERCDRRAVCAIIFGTAAVPNGDDIPAGVQ